MKIAFGNDHALTLEQRVEIVKYIESLGHEIICKGTKTCESTNYAIHGVAVGEEVATGEADLGVIICGTGVGISIAANKVVGAVVGLANSVEQAKGIRLNNNANVLSLGARVMSIDEIKEAIKVFLETEFVGGPQEEAIEYINKYDLSK